jgi:hypothetical protein
LKKIFIMASILSLILSGCTGNKAIEEDSNISTANEVIDEKQTEKDDQIFVETPPGISLENSVSYNIFDEQGNPIGNGTNIKSNNGIIDNILSFGNFIDYDREYLLIVLQNFKQSKFKVDNKEYTTYPFSLEKQTAINIKPIIEINKDTVELDYLIIRLPKYKNGEKDVLDAASLQEIFTMRFKIKNSGNPPSITLDSQLEVYDQEPPENIFISKEPMKFKMVFEAKPSSPFYLSLGNAEGKDELEYAYIAFNNWQQISLGDKVVHFSKVDNQQVKSKLYNFPEETGIYQIVAFPYPYKVDPDNYMSRGAFGSVRTTILK